MSFRVLLFGASGAIGSEIYLCLTKKGYEVVPVVHTEGGKFKFMKAIDACCIDLNQIMVADVTDHESVAVLRKTLVYMETHIDAVVYAVGSCPPGGMQEIIMKQTVAPSKKDFEFWENLLGNAFDNIHSEFGNDKRTQFVVIGSAITRMVNSPAPRPPFWKNMWPYARAQVKLDEDIRICRNNSTVHLIKPGAVIDTPFHQVNGEPPLYPGVTKSQVAEAVLDVLRSNNPFKNGFTRFLGVAPKPLPEPVTA